MLLPRFLARHRPTKTVRRCSEAEVHAYRGRVSSIILDLWTEVGRGLYSDGLFELVDPADYADSLEDWIEQEDRIPFIKTAFNDIYYYRDRGNYDFGEGDVRVEDVSILDVNYRTVRVCSRSVETFFEHYLVDEAVIANELREEVVTASVARLGPLAEGEGFVFTPHLVLGGNEDAKIATKGDSLVTLDILRELTPP